MTPNLMHRLRGLGLFVLASMLLSGAASQSHASVTSSSDCLPPLGPSNAYIGMYHSYAVPGVGTVVLSNSIHSQFSSCTPPPAVTTTHSFDSMVSGDFSVDGVPFGPFQSSALTTVSLTFAGMVGPTRFFDTEMLQLDVPSSSGMMVRESPTLKSTGKTSVTDLGSGSYLIDSFFDVFTEISLDGGLNWTASIGSTTMTLVPEPTTVLLMAVGLGVVGTRVRRRRVASH